MVEEGLVRKLRALKGIAGAVIMDREGIVLADNIEGNAEEKGAVAVFVSSAADQIGETLALGDFDTGVVKMRDVSMLVLERPDYYVGLLLGNRASPAWLTPQIETILTEEQEADEWNVP